MNWEKLTCLVWLLLALSYFYTDSIDRAIFAILMVILLDTLAARGASMPGA